MSPNKRRTRRAARVWRPNALYFWGVLSQLKESRFHGRNPDFGRDPPLLSNDNPSPWIRYARALPRSDAGSEIIQQEQNTLSLGRRRSSVRVKRKLLRALRQRNDSDIKSAASRRHGGPTRGPSLLPLTLQLGQLWLRAESSPERRPPAAALLLRVWARRRSVAHRDAGEARRSQVSDLSESQISCSFRGSAHDRNPLSSAS